MLIDKNWDFETAISEISKVYYPGGKTTGQLRNRQVETWGQIVGKTRAVAEFDEAIKKYGSLSVFGREYRATVSTLRSFRHFFESLPDDQTKSEDKIADMVKVFISYSWDNDEHKNWVRELASRLRSDGIDVTLDQWHLVPGDQLPEFMERAVRESDYVLIVCTHKYKERSNNRQGGVGYEGDIITAESMTTRNQRKFIPLLKQKEWKDSAPSWMAGKVYIDFSSSPYNQNDYDYLLSNLLGTREQAPPIKAVKKNKPIIAADPPARSVSLINPHHIIESRGSITSAALSPDGVYLFLAFEGGVIQVWNTAKGLLHDKVVWEDRMIESMICPDNLKLIATSAPKPSALWAMLPLPRPSSVLQLWHVTDGILSLGGNLTILESSSTIHCKAMLTQDKNAICVSRQINSNITHPFDDDTFELYTNDVSLYKYNSDTHKVVRFTKIETIESIKHRNFYAGPISCAISPNGKLIAISSPSETILRSYHSASEPFRVPLLKDQCRLLTFFPDSKYVIGEKGKQIWIWDVQSGKPIQLLDGTKPAVSPDGTLLAGVSNQKDITLWRTKDWTVFTELKQHTREVQYIIFSRSGGLIVSTDTNTTCLWRLQS